MPRATRRRGHALRVRVAAVVVLGGYLAVLGATTTGHGLRLALHLVAEHHEAHGHDAEHGHDGHDAEHREAAGPHSHHDEDHDEPGPEVPHAHHGRVHTHHEGPPPPAWLSVSLDKHVGPPDHRMPPLRPVRRADVLCPHAPPAAVVVAVEVPPPRREA